MRPCMPAWCGLAVLYFQWGNNFSHKLGLIYFTKTPAGISRKTVAVTPSPPKLTYCCIYKDFLLLCGLFHLI
jgi:hypothetical protein